jgi:hypothetical protein
MVAYKRLVTRVETKLFLIGVRMLFGALFDLREDARARVQAQAIPLFLMEARLAGPGQSSKSLQRSPKSTLLPLEQLALPARSKGPSSVL